MTPEISSVTVTPIYDFHSLNVGDLIVLKQCLYKITKLTPKPKAENGEIWLERLWGEPDKNITDLRYFSTFINHHAVRLTIS